MHFRALPWLALFGFAGTSLAGASPPVTSIRGAAPGPAQRSQAEPRVHAQLSTGIARLGERVSLKVIAENASRARVVETPEVPGLAISPPGTPSSHRYMSTVNGRAFTQSQLTWSMIVRPTQLGEFEIPPLVLEVSGKRMETQPLKLKAVRDLQGEDLGFLDVRSSTTKVVEGQPFTLELRFGWDEAANINYANLSLPWWSSLPGTIELEEPELAPTARTVKGVLINDREVIVQETTPELGEEGRRVLRTTRRFLPVRSGTLEFPTSFLEFGRLRSSQSFFSTRNEKLSNYYVRDDPFELEVVALPTEGQPLDYSGAVGSIAARASVDSRDVVVGDSIKLTVDWTGAGNLEFFDPPDPGRLEAFSGFRVYGATEEKHFDRRRVVYDLAPLSEELTAVPPITLSVFDPEEEAYTSVTTEEIPIRVRPLENAVTLADADDEGFERDIRDIDARPLSGIAAGAEPVGPSDGFVLAALLGVPVVWLGGRTAVRRRRGDPDAPLERRRRRALRALSRDLGASPDPRTTLEAFQDFLAARTKEPAEAWTGRDFVAWNAARGDAALPDDEARAARELSLRLDRSVYGGGPPVPPAEVSSVATRLVRAGL